jgi:hypothetical protein
VFILCCICGCFDGNSSLPILSTNPENMLYVARDVAQYLAIDYALIPPAHLYNKSILWGNKSNEFKN